MEIALDWDGTAGADVEGWGAFVDMMKARGHNVTIVTWRYADQKLNPEDNTPVHDFCKKHSIKAVFTGREPKMQHFRANVWIDDNPDTILRR